MKRKIPSSSSPSSSSINQWKYDVFLNFKGEDTRYNFTDHLYAALQRNGILTFRDEEKLERGKPISVELLKAIEESQFAIVILSRNYASSKWCLDELAKIVTCMKMRILPIFYDVDPSDVRKLTGPFEQAFIDHQERFKDNIENVETWRAALIEVANISGWHLQNRHESEFIQHIVEKILHKLSSKLSSVTKNLVGMDSTVENLITSYLGFKNNVCMTGIYGMGGLGKSTLARVVYDKFCSHFEGSSFIANVREDSEKYGLHRLQRQLIVEISDQKDIEIWNADHGVNMIKKMLCHKKVLLVIDDVDKLNQLEKLVGENEWFGLGSWIIITTRDEHLLVQHGVHKRFKPSALNDCDALKLFCLKAFKSEQPEEGYMQLSQNVVFYAKGLPLALVTLGSFLVKRTMDVWQSALDYIKKVPKREIFDILKVSYDGLEEMLKEIFLDIACFFRGEKKDRVIEILENCGFDARIGISVLMDKSLLTIENEVLWMHDLLQEMGREIVRQESPQEPRKRSRLWRCKDLFHVLTNDMATEEAIQGVVLNSFEWESNWNFGAHSEPFSKMCNLRLLIIRGMHIPWSLNHVSNDLRFLQWSRYSSKCLPSSFQPKELVELNLQSSQIEYLWEGVKYLDKLRCIDLTGSNYLIQTLDFTGVPRLERLYLSYYTNLVEIHPSIAQLKRLIVLYLECCQSLTNFPSMTSEMQSLTILNLCGCSKIQKIPEFKGIMKSLSELYLGETAIEKLPSSIECLSALTILNLKDCENLECLPTNMDSLRSLEKLVLSGCSKLVNLPENIWKIKCFKELDLSGMSRPEGIGLNVIGCLSSLKYLTLSASKFVTLPASINQLSKLEALDLSCCSYLQSLPELPSTVRYIDAQLCYSLQPVHPASALKELNSLSLPCPDLHYEKNRVDVAFTILYRYLQGLLCRKTGNETYTKRKEDGSGTTFQIIIPGFQIPSWITHRSIGKSVKINLPPNWCDSRWMGFALCARLNGNYFTFSGILDKGFGFRARVMALGEMPHSHYVSEMFFNLKLAPKHTWLLYIPRDDWFATVRNSECSQVEVVFETSSPALNVENCGVSLVYEQDKEEFNQTIAQRGITFEGWDGVHGITFEGWESWDGKFYNLKEVFRVRCLAKATNKYPRMDGDCG